MSKSINKYYANVSFEQHLRNSLIWPEWNISNEGYSIHSVSQKPDTVPSNRELLVVRYHLTEVDDTEVKRLLLAAQQSLAGFNALPSYLEYVQQDSYKGWQLIVWEWTSEEHSEFIDANEEYIQP